MTVALTKTSSINIEKTTCVMEDMINQRVTSIHAASNLVDCWDNLSIRGFTLSMACSTRVSNIPLLFRNESTTIILDNLKNQLLVDYLIRLNGCCRTFQMKLGFILPLTGRFITAGISTPPFLSSIPLH